MSLHLSASSFFRRDKLLTVLDVGSTKTTCIIARLASCNKNAYLYGRNHRIEVLGFGMYRSQGIKAGMIIDMAAAEQSIRFAVDEAERMAGIVVESLIVNFSTARMKSLIVSQSHALTGCEVTREDSSQILAEIKRKVNASGRHLLHAIPISYRLDEEENIVDPIGMTGQCLAMEAHILTTELSSLRNLELCINRAHLSVEAIVATPYATGLAVLGEDEARLGAACIDLGGGTTNIAVFMKNKFVYADTLPLGGDHITRDIACSFSTPLNEAERLKTLYGSALQSDAEEHQLLSIKQMVIGHGEKHYTKGALNHVILARVEEILEFVRDRLNYSGHGRLLGKHIILTGGGAQLPGIADLAQKILGYKVRIGRPLGVSGLPNAAKGASFSTLIGLLVYPQAEDIKERVTQVKAEEEWSRAGRPFQRVGQWLRKNF